MSKEALQRFSEAALSSFATLLQERKKILWHDLYDLGGDCISYVMHAWLVLKVNLKLCIFYFMKKIYIYIAFRWKFRVKSSISDYSLWWIYFRRKWKGHISPILALFVSRENTRMYDTTWPLRFGKLCFGLRLKLFLETVRQNAIRLKVPTETSVKLSNI